MNPSIYTHMQAAVDIVATSEHPTNKIAATIAGNSPNGPPYTLSRVNHWPAAIAEKIGREADIGNSSGTIHAETTCILDAPQTKGASVFITDPPCPNCMKNLAEAGIAKLYIDHKGFDKDWAGRRGDHFENMSMRIAAKAGIDVLVLYRKEQHFEVISRHAPGYQPSIENPAIITETDEEFAALITQAHQRYLDEPLALALATDTKGKRVAIEAGCHPTIGYTSQTLENLDNKYSFILQPVNRLLMNAARKGLTLAPEHIYSSRVPTSRELVNIIGAGLTQIQIGDINKSRDEFGPQALEQLQSAGIFTIQT